MKAFKFPHERQLLDTVYTKYKTSMVYVYFAYEILRRDIGSLFEEQGDRCRMTVPGSQVQSGASILWH